jgi:energy-coupling factor transporter transmembrane protein EcfT
LADILVVIFVVSILVGIKRPILGALAGMILAPLIFYFFHDFNLYILIFLVPVGFVLGWIFAFLANWLFSGFRGGKHNEGPSYTKGLFGGSQSGGIVRTDEEMKNSMLNENRRK